MGRMECAPFDLAERVEPALAVMAAAFALGEQGSRERAQIVRRHADRTGLIAVAATTDCGRLVGFCYGFPSDRSAWWERQIRPHLERAGTAGWLDRDTFALTELHVHPDFQGRGLGRRLITAVLSRTDKPKALLSVRAGESPARRLYRKLGFADVTEPFHFGPGQPAYTVMGAALPTTVPAAPRLALVPRDA
jgi:ribosomal protein S18 acetylase RimI-like enzyme